MSVSATWGTTAEERGLAFPCDRHLDGAEMALFRGVDVVAEPAVLFRWLCQLRAAPYSYDWIDNWGRRSPLRLTPGLERLEVGQTVMTIFELVEFERDVHLTIRTFPGRAETLFGRIAATYLVRPLGPRASCRLLVKLLVCHSTARRARPVRHLLPWGDLLMMRRQLLNLKRLAERDAPGAGG